jgi:hypothetical protein
MRQSIRMIGGILLAISLSSPAWAGHGHGKGGPSGPSGPGGDGGESQAGGLPALEDRVEADEALIATLQTQVATLMSEVSALQAAVSTLQTEVADLLGRDNFAVVSSACTATSFSSSVVSTTPLGTGQCEVTFNKNVSGCSAVATIVNTFGEIVVLGATKTITGDSVIVGTQAPAGTFSNLPFNLTVTCS